MVFCVYFLVLALVLVFGVVDRWPVLVDVRRPRLEVVVVAACRFLVVFAFGLVALLVAFGCLPVACFFVAFLAVVFFLTETMEAPPVNTLIPAPA